MSRQVQVAEDTRPIDMPSGLPFHKGDTNKVLLRAAWKAAGVVPTYPVDTRTVFALLRIMGYDATRQVLDYHFAAGYLSRPKKVNKEFRWDEKAIVSFADSLESTRNYLPLHQCHVHKLTRKELAAAQVEAAKRRNAAATFSTMSPIELINVMANCESQADRELIAFALKNQLELLDVRGAETVPAFDPAEVN